VTTLKYCGPTATISITSYGRVAVRTAGCLTREYSVGQAGKGAWISTNMREDISDNPAHDQRNGR